MYAPYEWYSLLWACVLVMAAMFYAARPVKEQKDSVPVDWKYEFSDDAVYGHPMTVVRDEDDITEAAGMETK